jgi:hypothetical protein
MLGVVTRCLELGYGGCRPKSQQLRVDGHGDATITNTSLLIVFISTSKIPIELFQNIKQVTSD